MRLSTADRSGAAAATAAADESRGAALISSIALVRRIKLRAVGASLLAQHRQRFVHGIEPCGERRVGFQRRRRRRHRLESRDPRRQGLDGCDHRRLLLRVRAADQASEPRATPDQQRGDGANKCGDDNAGSFVIRLGRGARRA